MQRPNVLVLYTDQQRWDALGAAGNPDILTPNLDRLATSGTMFSHHFVQNPVCMPSRASFLSGRYPATLGITHMGVPLPEDVRLLPHYLGQYGYRTANIGKLHALPHANRDHRLPHPAYGFDHLEISDEPGPYEDAYRAWVRHKDPAALDQVSLRLPPMSHAWQQIMGIADGIVHPRNGQPKRAVPFPAPAGLTHTAFVAEQTRAFIEGQGSQPWLCVAGFYSPHSPWVVPQAFLDLYDPAMLTLPSEAVRTALAPSWRRTETSDAGSVSVPGDDELRSVIHGYYAMVSEVDHHVGQILDLLDDRGLTDSTMVVFTSDHGEWLGRYGRYGKGHPGDDAVTRVPLIIRNPAAMGNATALVETIVEAVDVLPTVLDAVAIQVPPILQGLSLLPLIRGEPVDTEHDDSAITEHSGWKSLRTRTHRYLIHDSGEEALYDLDADPDGLADMSGSAQASGALEEHRHRLLVRTMQRERPLPRTWRY